MLPLPNRLCVFCRVGPVVCTKQPWLCEDCSAIAWPPAGPMPVIKRKVKKK